MFFLFFFIHIIVPFTSQSEQYKYIQQQQITCLCFINLFGIEKKSVLLEKKTLLGVKQNSIDMYVGKNIFKRLVQMLPFLNMLVCFISIKCYDFFQSSSLFNVVSLISHEVIDLYTLRMYFVDTHTSRNTKCTQ